jgi:hypothetical protein
MSIPASDIVQVLPSVLSAGGTALALNGVILTQNSRVPIGTVRQFANAADVGSFFGLTSTEYQWAATYFRGRNNATIIPGALLFAQYPESAVAAWLRGGSLAAMTLAQLQALAASTLTVISDGVRQTSASINLSGATSFSNAAALIQAAFTTPTFTVTWDTVASAFVVTNTTTGATSTLAFAESPTASASACTTAAAVLTVGGTVTGTFNVGDTVTGTDGVNTLSATIINQLTGTPGGAGTYTISAAATPGNLASAAVTATGATGTFAVALKLTSATGATLSQGAAAAVPSTFMAGVTALTLNWGAFSTLWKASNAEMLGFAQWESQQNNRFAYVAWDTNAAALVYPDTTTGIAGIIAANYGGVIPVYCDALLDPTGYAAAMVLGIAASIDFNRAGGRITMDFKYSDGVPTSVTSQTSASSLRQNGYNFVGQWATANDNFTFLNPGAITGQYLFADEYLNQVYLNSQIQLALMTLLTSVNSIPYNDAGAALINSAIQDPINQALTFGSIVPGVALSASQIAQVNSAAGLQIDRVLSTRGWYLQVGQASAQVRAARGTPPVTLFYMDGGAVQQINVASILVQ